MKIYFYKTVILISFFFLNAGLLFSQQLAFPTAEGYGKYTTGGRGGAVYEVTNLNSSGAGSLGAAIDASGPRTVVFRVSGTITGNFSIKNGDITIAGQTAPGDGICIKGNLSTGADNIIIRYIRVRWDPAMGEKDAIGGRYQKNIIIDHVSASWSTDETFTLYHNENTTVQWCIIAQPCPKTFDSHRFGGIWGNQYGTWHHNLIAHSDSRNPRWASGCGYNDSRNNVLYNWGYESCYGGEAKQSGDRRNPPIEHSTINMIANYYKAGPATGPRSRIANPSTRDGEADAGKWWLSGNVVEGYPAVTEDNWKGFGSTALYFRLNEAWDAMPINQQTPEQAYQSVLDHAGCSLPRRDKVDADIIDDVRNGTAKYGDKGIIDSPSDVGGWPVLQSTPAPTDTDHDGMPDDWEDANGLDKNDPLDRNGIGADGYTNLEIYLNSITEYPAFLYYPVNVSAELTGITKAELSWNDITEGENGFRIERAEGDTGSYTTLAKIEADATSYVDSVLSELTLYRYRVLAFNDSLTSAYEKEVSLTTLGSTSLPTAITYLSPSNRARDISTDTALMWTESFNAESYDVYFGKVTPPPFVSNQTETIFDTSGLEKGARYYWRIDSKNSNGTTEGSIWYFYVEDAPVSVLSQVQNEFVPVKIFPNPFITSTTIRYELKAEMQVKLSIYNAMGKEIASLVNQRQSAGEHSIIFDADNLESGIYFFSLKTGLSEQRGKILYFKQEYR